MDANSHDQQGVVLRIPASLRDRAATLASEECLSLNLFIASALAEKINRLERESRSNGQTGPSALPASGQEDALLRAREAIAPSALAS